MYSNSFPLNLKKDNDFIAGLLFEEEYETFVLWPGANAGTYDIYHINMKGDLILVKSETVSQIRNCLKKGRWRPLSSVEVVRVSILFNKRLLGSHKLLRAVIYHDKI